MSETRTYELGGGKYTATQNADGTWNILDVPICGEIPETNLKSHPWNGKPIDREWMLRAVENHQRRFKQDSFRPPLHVEHHEPGVKTERAGEFIPTRVGKLQYEGKLTDVILADLISIPEEVFKRIEKGGLPYLSIESGGWEDEEFTSCAIMDDNTPFFRFPNLTVGEKVTAAKQAAESILEPVGMSQSYVATERGVRVLCKAFTGVKLADDETEKKDDPKGGEEKPPKKDGEEKPADAMQSSDALTLLRQILTTLNLLAKQQTGVGAVAEPGTENKAPVEQEPPMSDDKNKKPAASDEVSVKLASLEGEVLGLKAKNEDRDKADQAKARANKAIESLAGWHLTEDIKKKISLYAAEANVKLLDAFVESIKANVPKDPPTTLEAFEHAVGGPASGGDPEVEKVLASYQARGPEVLEQVRKFIRLYAEAKQNGLTRLPVDSFVAAQFMGLKARTQLNGAAR